MDKATAVEVAHAIKYLLITRATKKQLERTSEAYVPNDVEIRVATEDATLERLTIPAHVLRHVIHSGALDDACEKLIHEHERILSEVAGITVEEDNG